VNVKEVVMAWWHVPALLGLMRASDALDKRQKEREKRSAEKERLVHEYNLKNDPEYRKAYEWEQSVQKEETKKNLRDIFLLLVLFIGLIVFVLYLPRLVNVISR
jgi:hypothetical protein